ncbi:MAG: peptidylprolyl isomerase [Stagnimonas sp.]|nr:peptidylprolyl isomerase [Stagnimonas sp.]
MSTRTTRALREPLVQFLLFGALLFLGQGLSASLWPTPADAIRVPATRVQALRQELRAQLQRPPSEPELQAAIQRWVDEELLFREAKALELDRADPIVRRRLVQKIETLIEAQVDTESPSDAELRALLDADPQRYGLPVRYSFEQRLYARGQRQEHLQRDAEAGLRQLRQHPEDSAPLGDPFFAGKRLNQLDAAAVRKVFGEAFAQRLVQLPTGRWEGPIASGYGLHLVRLSQRSEFQPATLESARARLSVAWRVARRQALLDQRLAQLRQRQTVTVDSGPVLHASQAGRGPDPEQLHEMLD